MKTSLELDKVVLLGRTFDEYLRYFALDPAELQGKSVLDIASGVSSFCAEANEKNIKVTAFDPIYEMAVEQIQQRCEPDLDFITKEIGKVKAYRWEFYKSPEGMRQYREKAYKLFLQDYKAAKGERYIFGKLPNLPFADQQFDLTFVSYFLFVYEDQFDYEFHKRSILEVMRVTSGEARIYPLVNFAAERCKFIDRLKADSSMAIYIFEEVTTDFEFLANSNSFLKIRRK